MNTRIMTRNQISEKLREIVTNQLNVHAGFSDNAHFVADLGADSLDLVELAMAVEEEFKLPREITENDEKYMQTFGSAVDRIYSMFNAPQMCKNEFVHFLDDRRIAWCDFSSQSGYPCDKYPFVFLNDNTVSVNSLASIAVFDCTSSSGIDFSSAAKYLEKIHQRHDRWLRLCVF